VASVETLDLILLDVMMPEMNGYETCAALKENEVTKGVPIIFVSAGVSAPILEQTVSLGANDYLPMPYKAADLKEKIDKLLAASG